MKHKIGFNRLGRKTSHREALIKNMITSLFKYERITTTQTKALAIRQKAEKMITRAKVDSVHNRRMIGRRIKDEAILAKLFTDIGPRFVSRPGGYTRIMKLGQRSAYSTEMVILELVDRVVEEKAEKVKPSKEDKDIKKTEPKTKEPKVKEASGAKKATAPKASAPKAANVKTAKSAKV